MFHADERSEQARENVNKRWQKRTKRKRTVKGPNTDGIQTVYGSDTPSPNPFPIPSPLPNPYPYPLPTDIDLRVWKAFVEMRKKIPKKPFTDYAATCILEDLERLHANTGQKKNDILKHSIKKGWAGVFEIKQNDLPNVQADDLDERAKIALAKIKKEKADGTAQHVD
jgi:hypothetical protein